MAQKKEPKIKVLKPGPKPPNVLWGKEQVRNPEQVLEEKVVVN